VAYSDVGLPTRITDDNGHVRQVTYDGANRRSIETDQRGNSIRWQYDANGNAVTITESEKSDLGGADETYVSQRVYDPLDRIIRTIDPAGYVQEYRYDSRGNLVGHMDALRAGAAAAGNRSTYTFDGLNRMMQSVRALTSDGTGAGSAIGAISTKRVWDDSSRLVKQIDDRGNATTYEYDALDRHVSTEFADGTRQTITLDAHGNPVTLRDANGTALTSTFDLLNRVIRRDVRPGTGVSAQTTFESYTYDGLSRLVRGEDDDSQVERGYDSLNHLTLEILNGRVFTASYDGVGNMLQVKYPGGRELNRAFDELNRLRRISEGTLPLAAYDYTGPRRVAQRNYANGTATRFAYDADRRIARLTHLLGNTAFDDLEFAWDGEHNKLLQRELPATSGLEENFGYDSASRLIASVRKAGANSESLNYTLDGVGNRLNVTENGVAGPYVLDNASPEPNDAVLNQYTSTPFDTRRYDANGNLIELHPTGSPARVLQFDYRNQLVSHIDPGNGLTSTYAYDVFGRRIAKTVLTAETRYSYWDWQLCEEQDPSGATLATYVHGNWIDEVLTMRRDGKDYWYHANDLHSVRHITDSTGKTVERYAYGDYGEALIRNAAGQVVGASQIGNPWLFTGRQFDPETGFYEYRNRYLDPQVGRFISRDPGGLWSDAQQKGNAFNYAAGNPGSRVDPTGLYTIDYDQWWKWAKVFDDSQWRKNVIERSLDLIKLRLDKHVIPALQAEIAEIAGAICQSQDGLEAAWLARLITLLSRMAQMSNEIAGTADIEFELQDLGSETWAQAMFYTKWGPPTRTIQLNDTDKYPRKNFFNQSSEEQVATLFHELSHVYGTEDEGEDIQNAHSLEKPFKNIGAGMGGPQPFKRWLEQRRRNFYRQNGRVPPAPKDCPEECPGSEGDSHGH
jgi:RHS repeat-associated protein